MDPSGNPCPAASKTSEINVIKESTSIDSGWTKYIINLYHWLKTLGMNNNNVEPGFKSRQPILRLHDPYLVLRIDTLLTS